MAFRRAEERKDFELPTFIDIIFLLLIFFLLTYSPVPPKVGQSTLELNLPNAEGAAKVNQSEKLETMMIEIMPVNKEKPQEGLQVSVLLPFENYDLEKAGAVKYKDAKTFAKIYQREAVLPANYVTLNKSTFLALPAVKLINDQLDRYVQEKFRISKLTNRIEIRADRSVSFRIINFIIEKCSSYEDLIPSLVFRTMFRQE